MARQLSGTNQYLQGTIDLSGASGQVSILLWYWWDGYALDDDMLLEFGTGGVSDGGFSFDWNDSGAGPGGKVALYTYNAGQTQLNTMAIPRPSVAGWHQLFVTIDRAAASSSVNAFTGIWIDGSAQTLSDLGHAALSPVPFGNLPLTVFARSDGSLAGAGRAAELAIWKAINLVQADVDALWNSGAGVDASTVQAGTLAYYNQLCGNASPEPPKVGSTNLTVTGATSVAHPISGAGICAVTSNYVNRERGTRGLERGVIVGMAF